MVYSSEVLDQLQKQFPLLNKIVHFEPVIWSNPDLKHVADLTHVSFNKQDIEEADELWKRFAPFLSKAFTEVGQDGVIESPFVRIPEMQVELNKNNPIQGDVYLKCDNALPVAGSIKARGGFYEVLHYAESLALGADLISKNDDYEKFLTPELQSFFKQYQIGVASTGNLGLSIGIMSAKLGFQVAVYMSADAKQWKKDLLRKQGVHVYEYAGDFSEAIDKGREETLADPNGYFIDDEDSELLFFGYSTAALRLEKQLAEKNIKVDETHPLFVYLPCGVGGAPGGITFGLKQVFGDHVHCFFAEPTHSPSALVGLLTGREDEISVQDIGLDNLTEADGLAVGRPSRFATTMSEQLVSGIYTIADDQLFSLLTTLWDTEGIFLEPSATAGLVGPGRIMQTDYAANLPMDQATHIVWATGGALVPEADRQGFYEKGKN